MTTLEKNEPSLVELPRDLHLYVVCKALAKCTIDEAVAKKERALLKNLVLYHKKGGEVSLIRRGYKAVTKESGVYRVSL